MRQNRPHLAWVAPIGWTLALLCPPASIAAEGIVRGVTGEWVGSGSFVNDWASARCRYSGGFSAVTISLQQNGARASGRVTIQMPPEPGSGCPWLRKEYVVGGTVAGTRLEFSDPAGGSWTLKFTTDLIGGSMAWQAGRGANEALAVGTSASTGETPLTRLRGTVILRRRDLKKYEPPVPSPTPDPFREAIRESESKSLDPAAAVPATGARRWFWTYDHRDIVGGQFRNGPYPTREQCESERQAAFQRRLASCQHCRGEGNYIQFSTPGVPGGIGAWKVGFLECQPE